MPAVPRVHPTVCSVLEHLRAPAVRLNEPRDRASQCSIYLVSTRVCVTCVKKIKPIAFFYTLQR